VINFEAEDPVEALQRLTGGIGPDRVIDAVGVDATSPESRASDDVDFEAERDQVAPERNPQGENWIAGDAPSQALRWAVEAVAKAGTISIIGVYPPQMESFPIGAAMNKNLTIKMGNCNHRKGAGINYAQDSGWVGRTTGACVMLRLRSRSVSGCWGRS